MWNAEVGMWNVECGMWNVECGMWNVECGMWNVECGMWNVECGVVRNYTATFYDVDPLGASRRFSSQSRRFHCEPAAFVTTADQRGGPSH